MLRSTFAMPKKESNDEIAQPKHSANEFDQIISSVGPIAFAGACFPGIVAFIGLVCVIIAGLAGLATGNVWFDADLIFGFLLGLLLLATFGIVIGGIFAATLAFMTSALVVCLHWSTNRKFHPRLLCQLVGGLTGFWLVAPWGFDADAWEWMFFSVLLMATFAMAFAQHAAAVGYRNMYGQYERETSSIEFQFGIRHMLIGMTLAAAFIALFDGLPRVSLDYLACWVMLQSLSFVIGETIRKHRPKHGPSESNSMVRGIALKKNIRL